MDPITVEVIRGGLVYAAEEMGIVLRKTAYSHNIKERMDHSCAIFDSSGRLIAQAEHIPVHLGSMSIALKNCLKEIDFALEKGDMVVFNDPYISGTHLPDITLVAPAYEGDRLIGYVVNKAHHSDVGGKAPGSLPGDASEIYQEGLIIPPIRLVRRGDLVNDVLKMILSNVRTPKIRMGDLRAQIAANLLGIRRLSEITKKHGIKVLNQAIDDIIDYSERRIRKEISNIREGTYDAEDYLESTGTEDEPVKLRVRVKVKGDEISFDYTGTDPQVNGPVNAVLGVTLAGIYYVLMCITDPTIPMNEGCFRPVSVHVPEGCVLNPIRPAPVGGGNVETSQRNVDLLFKALSEAIPERVCAAGQGTMNNVCVGGIDSSGRQWVFYETIGGGYGGRYGKDGVDGVQVHMTNTMNTPIEAIEASYPVLFLRYELRKDSCGAGRWRGGCGIIRSWKLLGKYASLSLMAERQKLAPWGLFGGKSGATGKALIIRSDGTKVELPSKCTVKMSKGDVFLILTPGGGGYGDPRERSKKAIHKDLENELISEDKAKEDYGFLPPRK